MDLVAKEGDQELMRAYRGSVDFERLNRFGPTSEEIGKFGRDFFESLKHGQGRVAADLGEVVHGQVAVDRVGQREESLAHEVPVEEGAVVSEELLDAEHNCRGCALAHVPPDKMSMLAEAWQERGGDAPGADAALKLLGRSVFGFPGRARLAWAARPRRGAASGADGKIKVIQGGGAT